MIIEDRAIIKSFSCFYKSYSSAFLNRTLLVFIINLGEYVCYRSVEHIGGISMKRLKKLNLSTEKYSAMNLNSKLPYQVRGAFLYTLGGGAV